MASTPSGNSERHPTSYTAMSIGDVEAVGANCQMESCNQLDFLPFRCDSCHGKFCLDHRSETAHRCAKQGAWAKARAGRNAAPPRPGPPPLLEKRCAEPACETRIETSLVPGVHCPSCNRRYCLKHRMEEDHGCADLTPLGGARPPPFAAHREKGLAALDRLKSWGLGRKAAAPAGGGKAKKRAEGAAAAINALKAGARGDAKLAADKRVYLHVEASAESTQAKFPTGRFFFSREWTVGRVLDAAAKALQVENVNNRVGTETERLRVFHVEAGRLLEFSEKLGDVAQTGNTLVLLRGVGPPVPDLIQP